MDFYCEDKKYNLSEASPTYGDNLLDKSRLTAGKSIGIYVGWNLGTVSDTDDSYTFLSDYFGTEIFDIDKTYYLLSPNLNSENFGIIGIKCVYYDADKNAVDSGDGESNTTITLTSEKPYIRFMISAIAEAYYAWMMIVSEDNLSKYNGQPYKAVYEDYHCFGQNSGDSSYDFVFDRKDILASQILNPLYGKTLFGFGDSIMDGIADPTIDAGQGFMKLIADQYGMTYWNYSASGSRWIGNIYPAIKTWCERVGTVNEQKSPDYMLLCGMTNDCLDVREGTNDISYFGDVTDFYEEDDTNTFDTTTVMGAIEKSIYLLKKNHPYTTIVYIMEHKNSFMGSDDTIPDVFYAKMKKVIKKWNIRLADIYAHCNLRDYEDDAQRYSGPEWDYRVSSADDMTDTSARYLYLGEATDALPYGGWVYQYVDGAWSGIRFYDGVHCNLRGYKRFYVPRIVNAMLYGGDSCD